MIRLGWYCVRSSVHPPRQPEHIQTLKCIVDCTAILWAKGKNKGRKTKTSNIYYWNRFFFLLLFALFEIDSETLYSSSHTAQRISWTMCRLSNWLSPLWVVLSHVCPVCHIWTDYDTCEWQAATRHRRILEINPATLFVIILFKFVVYLGIA